MVAYPATTFIHTHTCMQAYPFKSRKRHGPDYTRQFPHLRARTKVFSSLLRIRNTATMAIHQFLQERGFVQVHTPVITSCDCEGAGDLFRVTVCIPIVN